MRRLIKKIHMYAGLLTFTAFTVYGIAGLHATFGSDTPPRTFDDRRNQNVNRTPS